MPVSTQKHRTQIPAELQGYFSGHNSSLRGGLFSQQQNKTRFINQANYEPVTCWHNSSSAHKCTHAPTGAVHEVRLCHDISPHMYAKGAIKETAAQALMYRIELVVAQNQQICHPSTDMSRELRHQRTIQNSQLHFQAETQINSNGASAACALPYYSTTATRSHKA